MQDKLVAMMLSTTCEESCSVVRVTKPGPEAYERVGRLLAATKRSQADLARAIGVPESTVSRGIRSHRGFNPHWLAIAKFFGITLDELMSFDPGAVPMPNDEVEAELVALLGEVKRIEQRIDQLIELHRRRSLAAAAPSSQSESATLRAAAERRTAYDAEEARRRLAGTDDEKQA